MAKKRQKRAAESGEGESDSLADMIAPMQELVERQKKLYVERHEYREATARDWRGRDRQWYDAATRELAALGYRPLADFVDDTVCRAMGITVIIRPFLSEDGTNVAAIYQVVQKSGLIECDLRLCDVESEFSDSSFLTTGNTAASAAASMPPQIRSTKYPVETPIPELVKRHDQAKRKFLASKDGAGVRVLEVRDTAECFAMQHRQEAIKAAFREGIGYLDPAEVRRIAHQQMPDDPVFADITGVVADVARRQEEMANKDPLTAAFVSAMVGKQKGKSSRADTAKALSAAMQQMQPNISDPKRSEIEATMTNLFASADTGDENAGMKNLFTLMAQLDELEPKEQKEAKRSDFEEKLAKANAEIERRRAAHVKKRLARGLSEKADTGKPEEEIIIHGLPISDLDYVDEPRTLTAMIKEINASKDRRDAEILAGLPLGHSRIGGLPDLPQGRKWPTHKGKRIPFIAQLSLADFPRDEHPLLPARGHLYAFALISNDKKHWPPPVSVFLYEGSGKSLARAKFPGDDEIWPDWTGERVYEILPASGTPKGRRNRKKYSTRFGETIGCLQGEMWEGFGTPGEIADDRMQDGDDWINLLTVHSEGSMQWSDAGHLCFLIRRSALKKHDFSNVIAATCSS